MSADTIKKGDLVKVMISPLFGEIVLVMNVRTKEFWSIEVMMSDGQIAIFNKHELKVISEL